MYTGTFMFPKSTDKPSLLSILTTQKSAQGKYFKIILWYTPRYLLYWVRVFELSDARTSIRKTHYRIQ